MAHFCSIRGLGPSQNGSAVTPDKTVSRSGSSLPVVTVSRHRSSLRAYFWHTNTVENYFSIFKRGIYGCYFHVSETHLHRYTAEFDFRYNNRAALGVEDLERANRLLIGAKGNGSNPSPSSGESCANLTFADDSCQLAGNHFLTVVEDNENLVALGKMVLRQGAQDILFR